MLFCRAVTGIRRKILRYFKLHFLTRVHIACTDGNFRKEKISFVKRIPYISTERRIVNADTGIIKFYRIKNVSYGRNAVKSDVERKENSAEPRRNSGRRIRNALRHIKIN